MAVLLDTNLLVRLANRADPKYSIADHAVVELHRRGETLHITSQNLIEFRNVPTRPKAANGLELTTQETEAKAAAFEGLFPLLVESPDIFSAWKALVASAGVIGKQVHDARLVAVCHVHGVFQLLTFNTAHFTLLATFSPGIVIVDPASV